MDKDKALQLKRMLKELEQIATHNKELDADTLRQLSLLAGECKTELFTAFVKSYRNGVIPRTNAETLPRSVSTLAATALLPMAIEQRAALVLLRDDDLNVVGKLAMIGAFAVCERNFLDLAEAAEAEYPKFDPHLPQCDCENCRRLRGENVDEESDGVE